MTKNSALLRARELWGRDAFVSRPNTATREHRHIVGYISYGDPVPLGYGETWEDAFALALGNGYTTERVAEVRAIAAREHPEPLPAPAEEAKPLGPRRMVSVDDKAKTVTMTFVSGSEPDWTPKQQPYRHTVEVCECRRCVRNRLTAAELARAEESRRAVDALSHDELIEAIREG